MLQTETKVGLLTSRQGPLARRERIERLVAHRSLRAVDGAFDPVEVVAFDDEGAVDDVELGVEVAEVSG